MLKKNKDGKTTEILKMQRGFKVKKKEYNINISDNDCYNSLSPTSLGPVTLKQDGVFSQSLLLENFYQGNKVMGHQHDLIEDRIKDNFYDFRDNVYEKTKPIIRFGRIITNVYIDDDGDIRRYNNVQARFFYCYWYKKLVICQPAFKRVKKMVDGGHIVTINKHNLSCIDDDNDMYKKYCDPSEEFDYSLALCCILKGMCPWMRYYNENKDMYDPLGFYITRYK